MKAPTEPIDIIHMIVRMLTREGRISFDIDDESDKLVISINTINREYGRLLGGGGQAVRDLNTITKSVINCSEVRLEQRADDSIQSSGERPCDILGLFKVLIALCKPLAEADVETITDGVVVSTSCQDDILIAAIDRTFYNIGRAQRGLFRIEWKRS